MADGEGLGSDVQEPRASRPGARRPDTRWVAAAVAAGVLGAVGLASRGSGVFGELQDGTSPFATTVARAVLGALAGALAGLAAVAALRATNPAHRLVDPDGRRPPWRRALRWAVPMMAVFVALGAAAGAATAPLEPRGPSTAKNELPESGGDGVPRARYQDLDGDGEPDLDGAGRPVLSLDFDGDGEYEARLVRCPGQEVPSLDDLEQLPDNRSRVYVDFGCDGVVDRVLVIDDRLVGEEAFGGSSGQAAGRAPIDRNPDLAGLVRSLLVLLLVTGVGVGLWFAGRAWARRTGRSPAVPTPDVPRFGDDALPVDTAAAGQALDHTVAVMLSGDDARAAIRAAYATLLEGFASAGLGRRPFEGPEEHLDRCLDALPISPDALRRLVAVFEVARFSAHPVGEDHRREALDALRQAQADLAGALAATGGTR